MEEVYDPSKYSATEHINIKEFHKTYKRALDKFKIFDFKNEHEDEFSNAFEMMQIDFTKDEKDFLSKSCSIKNLNVRGDIHPMDIKNISLQRILVDFKPIEEPSDLKCIKLKQKYCNQIQNPINMELYPKENSENLIDLKPGEDVLITISVMKPFKYQFAQTIQKGKLKLFKEITVLGRNTIAEFRDMIDCPTDHIICKEVSENPDFELNYPASKDVYPSGFIFIDGVFYNDFRKENSIDYSQVLRKWALEKNLGNFSTNEMQECKFIDLSPRIGYPYVYQHKACCEHIIIFSQIRLLNTNDCLSSKSYPYINKIARSKAKYCVICGVTFASWMIVDSDRLAQNNAPMCTTCFRSYNYIDGKKIGNFKAYPFTSLSEFL